MKKNMSTIILVLIFVMGLSVVLYPTVSNYINIRKQTKTIGEYKEAVAVMDDVDRDALYQEAVKYNEKLAKSGGTNFKNPINSDLYDDMLDIAGSGVMAYVTIPKINVELPIYHGTSEGILQVAVGHLEGSSLPVGGESTHCVISGHRGLPSSKLFTDLDELEVHDVFTITVLGKTLTYEVDQVKTVVPGDTEYLKIEEGKDYCTLLTCTPYGINTHRLLVRGKRVATLEDGGQIYVTADAYKMDTKTVAVIMAIPLAVLILIGLFVNTRENKKKIAGEVQAVKLENDEIIFIGGTDEDDYET
ncbi:MAG: class C sortase [Lachnospiraceae bacterium]|nr:class C sortase [Lachnospiraceae bacterium]